MPNFPLAPGGYVWRPLRQTKLPAPVVKGWDVVAYQRALNSLGYPLPRWGADGYFGDETTIATRKFQREHSLVDDGIAGGATQRVICVLLADHTRASYGLPYGIPYGHIEKESSLMLGNHTAPYADGSRDVGPVQENTNYFTLSEGFNPADAIAECGARVAEYHTKYVRWGVDDRRAWGLACGAWNAPSWTDTIARNGNLSDVSRAKIEDYIADVTVYAWPGG